MKFILNLIFIQILLDGFLSKPCGTVLLNNQDVVLNNTDFFKNTSDLDSGELGSSLTITGWIQINDSEGKVHSLIRFK